MTFMTLFTSGRRLSAVLLFLAGLTLLTAGCSVEKAATPDAEMSAAVKTRDDAKAIQAESQTRVNDANTVLDGK